MKFLFAGGECNNNCFADFGGCSTHKGERQEPLSPQMIAFELGKAASKSEQVFLYTPDMFSDLYYESILCNLPQYRGDFPGVYIAINAGVRTFIDKGIKAEDLIVRGIKEVWFGIESGSRYVRKLYGKPEFTNEEIVTVTRECKKYSINVCWYLITDADNHSKLATYNLITRCNPYRVRFARLTDEF